ncbi:MAG: hypothetical protein QGG48_01275 [Desulfatiglandales bacterium]|nr:hypothetical protein [Desulfatiglandales bacterium]
MRTITCPLSLWLKRTEMGKVLGIAFYNQRKLAEKGKKPTKFEYLVNHNIITDKELEGAVLMARDRKVSMESVFIDEMKVKKEEEGKSLAEYYHCE